MYSAKLKRQASRLGVTLPSDDYVVTDEGWSSDGEDTLFEGRMMLRRRNDGRWGVYAPKGRKVGGYRHLATVGDLETAVSLARFLRNRSNYRAFRGLAPKERTRVVEATPKEQLAELLARTNGGAVTVTS